MTVFNTVPNLLTIFRVLMIPIMVLFFYSDWKYGDIACSTIFIIASITDYFDGYIARSMKCSTKFGAFLDPVADKLLVSIALIMLVQRFGTIAISVSSMIIICREISVSALREWVYQLKYANPLNVDKIGKVKTFIQMASIVCVMLYDLHIGEIFLGISACLSVISMIRYINKVIKIIDKQ